MRIRRKFLELTSLTIKHGDEDRIKRYLPKGAKKDPWGNYYLKLGESSTMFTCHLDTCSSYSSRVNHVNIGKYVKTDGTTILGADDKAGMVVLLYMIEKGVPGLYYFFIGEEVGCIGSRNLAYNFNYNDITKVVSFDRRGTNSIITEQLYGKCCSDEFAEELAYRFNSTGYVDLEPDDTGIMTDSAQFVDLVPECTNISVGYYNEHTVKEIQDIEYLTNLCKACVLVDWESLPVMRDPTAVYIGDEEIIDYGLGWGAIENEEFYRPSQKKEAFEIFIETNFNRNNFTYIVEDDSIRKAYISNDWIETETRQIQNILINNGHFVKNIYWNGRECYGDDCYIANRSELINVLPDFEKIPYTHIRQSLTSNVNLTNHSEAEVYLV